MTNPNLYTFRKPPYGPTYPRWLPRMFPYRWEQWTYRFFSSTAMTLLIVGFPLVILGQLKFHHHGELVFDGPRVLFIWTSIIIAAFVPLTWITWRGIRRIEARRKRLDSL